MVAVDGGIAEGMKDWRVVKAASWVGEERRVGSMEVRGGIFGESGGMSVLSVGGGRRRDSQVWRSI